jgi:outer membrane receptor protein involved in Fe transport
LYSPSQHWHLKLLYGQAFRAPSLDETLFRSAFASGNPNLLPNRVRTADAGISYQTGHALVSLDFFDSRQTNSIATQGLSLPLTFVNLGSVTFRGLQWEGKFYLHQNLFLSASALLEDTPGQGAHAVVTPIPPLSGKAGVSYSVPDGWSLGVFEVYQGYVSQYSAALNPRASAYHSVSAHVRLSLARYFGPDAKNLALFAHGDNLANHIVWLPDWGADTLDTIPVRRGRTAYFGLEIKFKGE